MIFLTGATVMSASPSMFKYAGDVEETTITSITLKNAMFDAFYAGKNADAEGNLNTHYYDSNGNINYPDYVPSEWDFWTIMYMRFDTNALGGNVDWEVSQLTAMLIKRKSDDGTKWLTIAVREIDDISDLSNFSGVDITPGTGTYIYALVPVIVKIEGSYYTTSVDTKVTNLVIADYDAVYTTGITDGTCNVTHVVPNSVVETLNNTFPTIVSNTAANYRTIELSGSWYPLDDDCNVDDIMDDEKRIKYLEEFLKWLCDKDTKIVKNVDGRRYLVYITTPPSVSFESESYVMHTVTFGGTEVGDVNSSEDLYNCGIIDIPEAYIG